MSALPYAAAHNLEPPIAASSVPRCPCQRAQPCPCERYARNLERSQREYEGRCLAASETLRALSAIAHSDTMKASLQKLAESLF